MNTEKELGKQAREARAEYYRQWRAKNKDKVRENNRRYWERRAARMAEEKKKNGGCEDG